LLPAAPMDKGVLGMGSNITIKCPFYMWHKEDRISCEFGILIARKKAEKDSFVQRHCASLEGHRNCPLAKALYMKYESEGD